MPDGGGVHVECQVEVGEDPVVQVCGIVAERSIAAVEDRFGWMEPFDVSYYDGAYAGDDGVLKHGVRQFFLFVGIEIEAGIVNVP